MTPGDSIRNSNEIKKMVLEECQRREMPVASTLAMLTRLAAEIMAGESKTEAQFEAALKVVKASTEGFARVYWMTLHGHYDHDKMRPVFDALEKIDFEWSPDGGTIRS